MQEISMDPPVTISNTSRSEPTGADFETAIKATGYGTFNYILYVLALLAMFSSTFETTTMSYVFPAAECDLNLTLEQKGLLNACAYIGMIASALIWGYVCDTFGRKRLLSWGLILDGVCVACSGLAMTFPQLFAAKLMGGLIINGPYAALMSYVSEFHCSKYRARVQFVMGFGLALGGIILPVLALAILPLDYHLRITNYYALHSWNFLLLVCAIPPLLGGLMFAFLPESPKFLMTAGRNEKAIDVFRKVYRLNTGNAEASFPIKVLLEEKINLNVKTPLKDKISEGFRQIKPMFHSPHLFNAIHIFTMQYLIMNSVNTLRLWLPQLYQVINDYKGKAGVDNATLCEIMQILNSEADNVTLKNETCTFNSDNIDVYTNSMIVCSAWVLANVCAGMLVNAVGKKKLIITFGMLSGVTSSLLYISANATTTVALTAIFVGCGGVLVNVIIAVIVDLFPTTLRAMVVSLTMMWGRVGGMTGNIIFPYLLADGCAPSFFYVGSLMFGCAFLTLFLPNTDLKGLE